MTTLKSTRECFNFNTKKAGDAIRSYFADSETSYNIALLVNRDEDEVDNILRVSQSIFDRLHGRPETIPTINRLIDDTVRSISRLNPFFACE